MCLLLSSSLDNVVSFYCENMNIIYSCFVIWINFDRELIKTVYEVFDRFYGNYSGKHPSDIHDMPVDYSSPINHLLKCRYLVE